MIILSSVLVALSLAALIISLNTGKINRKSVLQLNKARYNFFNSKFVIKSDDTRYPSEILVSDEISLNDDGSYTNTLLKIDMDLILKKGEVINGRNIMINISKSLKENNMSFKQSWMCYYKSYQIFLSQADYYDFISTYGTGYYDSSLEFVLMNIPATGHAYVHRNKTKYIKIGFE